MVDFILTGNKCWEGSLSVDDGFICVLGRVWCLQDLGICLVSGNAFKKRRSLLDGFSLGPLRACTGSLFYDSILDYLDPK